MDNSRVGTALGSLTRQTSQDNPGQAKQMTKKESKRLRVGCKSRGVVQTGF